jgi:hypothetical protein
MIRKLEKIMGHKLERQTIKGFNYSVSTPPQQSPSPRKPKRTVTSAPREKEYHHLRRQHAQAKTKATRRY